MGSRRTEIKKIEDKRRRRTTFTKRRDGLFKKVGDLCNLCGGEAAVIAFSGALNAFAYGNPSVNSVIDRYLSTIPYAVPGADADANEAAQLQAGDQIRELQEKYEDALARLESEKRKGEVLDKVLEGVKMQSLFEIESLGLRDVQLLHDSMEKIQEMAMATNETVTTNDSSIVRGNEHPILLKFL
ncbi:hypothetical protein U1Q18_019742 [Sarracenia purpurea var. burkii]